MTNSFSNKALFLFIVLVAFVDGILVARHFYENQPEITQADSPPILEDIFEPEKPNPDEPSDPLPEPKSVPFTVQAPLGTWVEPWSDYAEEASVWMAYKWATGEAIGGQYDIAAELKEMGVYQIATFGSSKLTNIPQTLQILIEHLGWNRAYLSGEISEENIKTLLEEGNILIVPVNGQILDSPHYGDPAPKNHMILLYDFDETHFIVNDPGTKRGAGVKYEIQKILESIQDLEGERVMIVVSR